MLVEKKSSNSNNERLLALVKQREEDEALLATLKIAHEVDTAAGKEFSLAGVARESLARIEDLDRQIAEVSNGR